MLRITPIKNAAQAETYYAKSDGGYYLSPGDLHREWGGKGAAMLGLSGLPDYEHFCNLIHGRDPHTGEQLTAKLIDARISGFDITTSVPKAVTTALESGDLRIQDVIWQAARETMADIEAMATTRERQGGKQDDRLTQNLTWYAVEHAESRPAKDDKKPDWDRHLHFVCMNLTWDAVENQWKAVKIRPVMELRKLFDRRFDSRLASKLSDLGYEIETKWTHDARGGRKYYSWDIKGIPDSVVKKFSRRTQEVEALAKQYGVTDAVAKNTLGAMSRQKKLTHVSLAELREYWSSRVSRQERVHIEQTIGRARAGLNPKPESAAEHAMTFAVDHHFSRQSVVPLTTLEITALERSMGSASPSQVQRTRVRQGLLVRDGEATTKNILAEERYCIEFARKGRGTCQPLCVNPPRGPVNGITLSADQLAVARSVWESRSWVILIRGGPGTGKTKMMRTTVSAIEKPVVVLAPSADASRRTLRDEGFEGAETVAHFLNSTSLQKTAKNGVIWIDEAALLPITELRKVFEHAEELHARVVLQGDPNQHLSISRGAIFQVLQDYGGLPCAVLHDIRRQDGEYKRAVATIAKGDLAGGFDILNGLGWVKETRPFDRYRELVDEYIEATQTLKPNGEMTTAIVIAPTHKEKNAISSAIRERLKSAKRIGQDDHEFTALKPVGWTDAEKGDLGRYNGTEIIHFHRNSGPWKAGNRITASELNANGYVVRPEHFSVYVPEKISLSRGDAVRIVARGRDKTGKHKLENGATYTVEEITKSGDIRLSNGWVLDKEFGFLDHNYANTSYSSQGRTVDRAMVAMSRDSGPAINAAQFFVSVSRSRAKVSIYSDMSPTVLRQAIQRSEARKSATELIGKQRRGRALRERARAFMQDVRAKYRQLQQKARHAVASLTLDREAGYAR